MVEVADESVVVVFGGAASGVDEPHADTRIASPRLPTSHKAANDPLSARLTGPHRPGLAPTFGATQAADANDQRQRSCLYLSYLGTRPLR